MNGRPREAALANVQPLRRIRVLIASSDPHYARVASFLLRRAGFAVQCCGSDHVVSETERGRPHVVVLDASTSILAAARLGSALTTQYGDVAVVLVSDRPMPRRAGPRLSAKWDGVESLAREIERAYLRVRQDDGLFRGAE